MQILGKQRYFKRYEYARRRCDLIEILNIRKYVHAFCQNVRYFHSGQIYEFREQIKKMMQCLMKVYAKELKSIKQSNSFRQLYTSTRLFSNQISQNGATIETNELAELMKPDHPENERLVIFNGTLIRRDYVPKEDHAKERIPGSLWFDFKTFCEQNTTLSYMMPTDEYFSGIMKSMDVRKSDLIVVYDKYRMISAPRAFWMLKTFGVKDVFLLNGTFAKWQREGRPIEKGDSESAWKKIHTIAAKPDDYNYKKDITKIRKFEEIDSIVSENMQKPEELQQPLLDSRVHKYYLRGHIPTSRSLALDEVMDKDFCYLKKDDMVKIIQSKGIKDPSKDKIILTCQRGITACIVDAAFKSIGNENTSVYDGSFEEYAKIKGIEVHKE
ncbi:UNKNOWN [Stylonychia lemnae]|uniref:Rhodanese domain-containing protein n=1 Tax=Stylonychia lemnae TaxID=5949 RepID=A0A078B7U9_STYLE|nr:UNKNOWN [Stylonychia lemnae]|eukprot:CDW90459.1 UNKNOWN [Stylonychia lemnae]